MDEGQLRLKLAKHGQIILADTLNDDSVDDFIHLFNYAILLGRQSINIVLNSGGGVAHSAFAIVDTIQAAVKQEINVTILGTGIVASGALLVLQAGSERVITPNTRLLLHSAERWASDESLKPSEASDLARELTEVNRLAFKIVADRSGCNLDELVNRVAHGGVWLSPEEALEMHLIDRIGYK